MSDDYWYDDALFICEGILKEFSDSEWEQLLKTIPDENIVWRIRLAECLDDIFNPYSLQCIMKMIDTKNNDLFVACVDSLRCMDVSSVLETDKREIVKQVNLLIKNSI